MLTTTSNAPSPIRLRVHISNKDGYRELVFARPYTREEFEGSEHPGPTEGFHVYSQAGGCLGWFDKESFEKRFRPLILPSAPAS